MNEDQNDAMTALDNTRSDNTRSDNAAPEAADEPDGIAGMLAGLRASMALIEEQLRASHERAAARERVIDRLHDENQRLRAGERQLVLRPLLVDLQRLRAELLRQAGGLPAHYTAEQAAQLLRSFAHSAEMALERGGVHVLSPTVGAPFDATIHRAVEVVPAQTAADDGTIARVVSDGYLDAVQERAITPASVHVRRWTPAQPDPDVNSAAEQPSTPQP